MNHEVSEFRFLIRFNILLVLVGVKSCFTKESSSMDKKKVYFDTNQENFSEVFMDKKKRKSFEVSVDFERTRKSFFVVSLSRHEFSIASIFLFHHSNSLFTNFGRNLRYYYFFLMTFCFATFQPLKIFSPANAVSFNKVQNIFFS